MSEPLPEPRAEGHERVVFAWPLVLVAASSLYMWLFDRERWNEFKDRGSKRMGPFPSFSRLDTMLYGAMILMFVGSVGNAIMRTWEVSEQTERNTKEMGDIIDKMSASSDQSRLILAAMREEAEAARRETAAAQKLALWVGVGTAIVGAILGGVAGAFAAQALN